MVLDGLIQFGRNATLLKGQMATRKGPKQSPKNKSLRPCA